MPRLIALSTGLLALLALLIRRRRAIVAEPATGYQ
jgi:hypothetical protein